MDDLKKYFVNSKQITVNLRNAFEISSILSIIRRCYKDIDFAGTVPVTWPQQEEGHYLRGMKPVIHILQTSETSEWTNILSQELEIMRGSDSCLTNSDIAVLVSTDNAHYVDTMVNAFSVVERWNTEQDKITVGDTASSVSAEWAGIVYIYRYFTYTTTVTLPDRSVRRIGYSGTIPYLYRAMSRARVFCTVIMFNYTPNTCQYTDGLLNELRERTDICKIIEH
jgi:hypothetical protein